MYRVNDIFYSLQGEGYNTGRAAAFVRFAGCNLRCPFCDTEFDSYGEMSADDILAAINSVTPHLTSLPSTPSVEHLPLLIVLTGGEPTLQVDEQLIDLFHQHGYYVAMESNGTRPAPANLDWLTVSPKANARLCSERLPDELKLVFDEHTNPDATLSSLFQSLPCLSFQSPPLLYLQPCDTGDDERNAAILAKCVEYIRQHPQWRLSLQTHKLAGFK